MRVVEFGLLDAAQKGKTLCLVISSHPGKHILLHNDKGQANALIRHWNGFAA